MITIVNMSNNDSSGVNRYEIRINREVITAFDHVRSEGLAKCLVRAAEAVRKHQLNQIERLLEEIHDEKESRK